MRARKATSGDGSRALAAVSMAAMMGSLALLGCGQTTTGAAEPATPETKVVVCAAGSVLQGSECVPAKVDCPKNTVPREGQCVPVVEEPAAVAAAVDVAAPEPVAADPTFAAIVDPRRARLEPRARQLLITEIQGLESLFQSMAKDAEDRPLLLRRLAEGYVELSAAAARDGKVDGNDVVKMSKIEVAARTAAIKYYSQRIQQYPRHCVTVNQADPSKSSGCADEAQYYMSLEYVRAGELDKARKSLLQLIQNWPASPFVPHTYFQFGELFTADARSDPSKWAFAEQSYLEVAKYDSSPIAPAALLRLGQVYEATQDTGKARSTYKRLLRSHPKSSAAGMVPAGMR